MIGGEKLMELMEDYFKMKITELRIVRYKEVRVQEFIAEKDEIKYVIWIRLDCPEEITFEPADDKGYRTISNPIFSATVDKKEEVEKAFSDYWKLV